MSDARETWCTDMPELKSYAVWDASTRWFHWINALCVIALTTLGLVILNAGGLGVTNAGKAALKTIHVSIGYVFVLNLGWRIAWAFLGNRYARWSAMLPVARDTSMRSAATSRPSWPGTPNSMSVTTRWGAWASPCCFFL